MPRLRESTGSYSRLPRAWSASAPSRVRGVGVVLDLAVHAFAMMRYLVGSPVRGVYTLSGRGNLLDVKDSDPESVLFWVLDQLHWLLTEVLGLQVLPVSKDLARVR